MLMETSYQISASIVTYNSDRTKLEETIRSFLNTSSSLRIKLYILDNSPEDSLKNICDDNRCVYIFNGKNLGFGKAHNIALKKAITESKYHLVLNPDVFFGDNVLEELFKYMEAHPEAGQVMPKVLYPNGETQFLCKLLPTPFDLLGRRFFSNAEWAERQNRQYELHDSGYNKIMNIPCLSGCFMFLRTSALKKIGFFDERIFMYGEDVDLTRRMHGQYKTIFYPYVSIYHHYEKGSYKSFRLMLYNIHGAAIYFNTWGWFFDKDRKRINNSVIKAYLSGGALVRHEPIHENSF
jgi:GT2 family glycosyltransferase